ncbi:MAG: hypothetical protein IPJ65_09800 [Archangiaceae bacterium]|nr:hypothetical protein [Archangiaceae bacterium]
MNHFISGIIKIIILEAQVGLLLVDALTKGQFERHKKLAFLLLSASMVLAWTNFGQLNGTGLRLVHHHEQFHFYLGAKYQAEVGWFDLYRAAAIADSETTRALRIDKLRDNETFELEPISKAFEDRDRIVGRFGPRWEDFKRDWVLLMTPPNQAELDACEATKCNDVGTLLDCRARCEQDRNNQVAQWRGRFNAILQDHGNSNSPAWAVIAHPIAMLVPWSPNGQALLGWLDMALMALLWWYVFKTFDWKVTAIALLMWATPPLVFPYLAGSFLRWDWLFALGMTVCMMKREKWLYAGLFFGFAVATKLFPIWFGVALALRAGVTCWRDKKLHAKYRQMVAGTLISGVASVVLAALMFGGFWVWSDYKRRIDAAVHERFYNNQYSLKTVYLQISESSAGELATHWLFPAEMKQQRTDVDIADHQVGFKLFQLLFTFAILLLVLRTDEIGAFTLGPMLVFTWLTVNMYYWNMFGLMALGLARREGQKPALGALMGLHVIFMGYYLFVHTNAGYAEGYMVALQLCVWLAAFTFAEYRTLKTELSDLVSMLYGRKRA